MLNWHVTSIHAFVETLNTQRPVASACQSIFIVEQPPQTRAFQVPSI